jgi:tetratricopeptide (TPR) repeat protein
MVSSRKGARAQRKTSGHRRSSFAPLRLCVRHLLFVVLTLVSALSQTPKTLPDLTNLESEVREQITRLQDALAKALKDPKISSMELSEAYGKLGQTYHAYALTAPARECYLNANRLTPNDFRWIYFLARLDHQEGRFDDAIGRHQLAITLQPNYVAAHVNLGNIFLELNRLNDATESFRAALEVNPNNPAAHYGLGQVASAKRNYSEAIAHFEQTLAQVTGANRVHYSLAMAYRGLGNAEKARAHLAQQGTVGVRVADPLVDVLQDLITGERVHLARGKLAFEANRYAEAVAEFRKAVASRPDSVTARINLGAALSQIGDVKGAIEQFEEAIRLEPGRVNAHYNLAVLFARENKHAEAINHLQPVLSADPADVAARLLLARELRKSGKLDDALAQFARVYQTTGDLEHGALVALGLAELGRCTEAAELQRRLITSAEEARKIELLVKLRRDLKTYEDSQSCRPEAETSTQIYTD